MGSKHKNIAIFLYYMGYLPLTVTEHFDIGLNFAVNGK